MGTSLLVRTAHMSVLLTVQSSRLQDAVCLRKDHIRNFRKKSNKTL